MDAVHTIQVHEPLIMASLILTFMNFGLFHLCVDQHKRHG